MKFVVAMKLYVPPPADLAYMQQMKRDSICLQCGEKTKLAARCNCYACWLPDYQIIKGLNTYGDPMDAIKHENKLMRDGKWAPRGMRVPKAKKSINRAG